MHIPGYRIIRKINQGGMATVYLAIQTSVGRVVALKVMSPALDGDPTFSERFQVEANIVGQLSHPHIVSIYDIGNHEKLNYIAMDYLPDGSIHDKMLAGMSQDLALLVLKDIASALDHAHEKGYVHRDIKPENILFRDDNYAVLTDFGVARANSSSVRKTLAGTVVGTPHYMSPEQTRGKTVDARSDLYSLGIVFYEMLTGSVPYKGDEAVTIALKHLAAPIPTLPTQYIAFQPLVEKLLAKDPDQRYQQGRDLVAEIESIEFQIRNKSGLYGTDDVTLAQQFFVLFKVLFRKIRASIRRQSHHIYFYLKSLRWTKESGFYRKMPKPLVYSEDLTAQNTLIATRINQQLGQEETLWEEITGKKYRNHLIAVCVIVVGLLLMALLPNDTKEIPEIVNVDDNSLTPPKNEDNTVKTERQPTIKEPKNSPTIDITKTPVTTIPEQEITADTVRNDTLSSAEPLDISDVNNENHGLNIVNALVEQNNIDDIPEQPVITALPAELESDDAELESIERENKEVNALTLEAPKVESAEPQEVTQKEPQPVLTPESQAVVEIKEPTEQEKTYNFTVATTPNNARIRILNIREKYTQGMKLTPGRYRLEVTQPGFLKHLRWVTLGKRNLKHTVKLKKEHIAGNVFRHTLPNGVTGPSMVVIPKGSYIMGGIEADSRPKHKVTFKRYIAVSRHEITFNDYEVFAKSQSMPLPGDNRWGRGKRPIINVSWDEAVLYTQWLSKQSNFTYRLPTEAEWEYIARSGQITIPQKGIKKRANCRRGCLSEYSGMFKSKSAPVGQFEANKFGVFDTAGNVAEWVADCYKSRYDGASPAGAVVTEENCPARVVRGGSMRSKVLETSPDRRSSQPQHTLHKEIGFRVVVELKQ